jgi:hypothetical protein
MSDATVTLVPAAQAGNAPPDPRDNVELFLKLALSSVVEPGIQFAGHAAATAFAAAERLLAGANPYLPRPVDYADYISDMRMGAENISDQLSYLHEDMDGDRRSARRSQFGFHRV